MIRRFLIALLDAIAFLISPGRWLASAVIGFVAAVAAAVGVYDGHQIVTGTVDLNHRWPGRVPAVRAAFIAILRAVDRASSKPAGHAEQLVGCFYLTPCSLNVRPDT